MSLAGIPEQAARDGAAVGAAAAKACIDGRAGDGWEEPFTVLELPSLPGYWKPTPPNFPTGDLHQLSRRAWLHRVGWPPAS